MNNGYAPTPQAFNIAFVFAGNLSPRHEPRIPTVKKYAAKTTATIPIAKLSPFDASKSKKHKNKSAPKITDKNGFNKSEILVIYLTPSNNTYLVA